MGSIWPIHDPNYIVRRTIVRCIGATKLSLKHILERTRDIDEHVRRAAFKFMAETVHIKVKTISQREGVLKRGLGDRNDNVKQVVEKEMIPARLRLSKHNIIPFLDHLDVGNSDQDIKPGCGDTHVLAGAGRVPGGAGGGVPLDDPSRALSLLSVRQAICHGPGD